MNDKQKLMLAIALASQLLNNASVTDKQTANDIINIIRKIIKEGF